ncbi:ABC transporter ATP-binding protein [Falsirhodobacter algicola]|uniref:ATP-binding cassette domain-containing protein n=1 Tax=Falsirhodobacter algicola TaxID=2692330 RepID=A0A8J8MT98_9RHOB|nr:ABC transporter ATP-binding protein [Falsirhodobacter algicola]QUS36315.1 ATP-binding cassette domain-containing protein [Falsirhodobacter algicola]
MDPYLKIENLAVEVGTGRTAHRVLDGVSLSVRAGQTLAVVGESGCGKSMTALATMGLLPDRFRIAGGSIRLGDEELTKARPARMRQLRGNAISMIFQEPMTSLNPLMTVERQIAEVVELHQRKSGPEAREIALEMLRAVQIPSPAERLEAYPHELSGGMRQRVMIAIALACRPKVIIADEPTTALDVTVQAQIFKLLRELQMQTGTAILLITHDLGSVAEMADEVAVLYAGKCVETGPVRAIMDAPSHPYTRGLMSCTPRLRLGRAARHSEAVSLGEIPGMVPPLGRFPKACRFAPRCALADSRCTTEAPPLAATGPDHGALCWHAKAEVFA